jgi:NADH dehydrogenase FAD-containing subunit
MDERTGLEPIMATARLAPDATYDVVVAGAGYAGLMAALRLRGRSPWPRRIALINAVDGFVERVRLQEAIAAPVAPRIPSLTALAAGTNIDVVLGRVVGLDPAMRQVRVAGERGERRLGYDRLVYALGSHNAADRIPGVAEHAYRLDPDAGPRAVAALRERLTCEASDRPRVVVVGGAETAIEVAGEIRTRWPQIPVTMVSEGRVGGFKGEAVARAVRAELTRLGASFIDGRAVRAVRRGGVTLADGEELACDICVWSGGLQASPIARQAGLATDDSGRIWVGPSLRSVSHPQILAVGDAAHPLAPTGAPYRPSAFVAISSGAYAADTLLAEAKGRRGRPFAYSTYGQGVAIGEVGVGITTFPNDRPILGLIRGRAGVRVRNFFVWLLTQLLKVERRHPGLYVVVGRGRVSWRRANRAMESAKGPCGP